MLAESAVARARRSLFSRAELRERGVTEADLRKASAGGEWHRIQPGVYVAREEWETARPTDRHRFAILAAENRAREAGGVISHLSAFGCVIGERMRPRQCGGGRRGSRAWLGRGRRAGRVRVRGRAGRIGAGGVGRVWWGQAKDRRSSSCVHVDRSVC
ncbi:type IV toxin-antitoxin system AbiEi family antitoxin domain-containing protein [Microbacterium enclense]|uniref:type IV toxin-antitoxin system AbiEi family antitoxin domain-containing protein n=1 Tax=Microbacterium enclense TaxID=993073 RepID=UPI003F7EEFC1